MLDIHDEIKLLLSQKNYPCVAALQSFHRNDYWLKTYSNFGKVYQRNKLRNNLLQYIEEQAKNGSNYFTFWAVFKDMDDLSEDEFEKLLWDELSSLSSVEDLNQDKDNRFSTNPEDKNFCFSIGGKAFFVVGLHPKSSRASRRFPWPTLIFNLFEQFDNLKSLNLYDPMVKLNRQRDIKFQGDVNPMAAKHDDTWETIQFSGKTNPPEWKCPFHFRSKTQDVV